MLFKTHILLGIIFFLAFENFFQGGYEIIFFLLVLLGSVIPDIDERGSIVNRKFGIIGDVIGISFKHRGIFHSLFLAGLLFVMLHVYWQPYYAWGLLIGYIAHLVGDAITPMGVQIFYPFSRFKVRGPMRVGGITEKIIFIVLILLIIKWFL